MFQCDTKYQREAIIANIYVSNDRVKALLVPVSSDDEPLQLIHRPEGLTVHPTKGSLCGIILYIGHP